MLAPESEAGVADAVAAAYAAAEPLWIAGAQTKAAMLRPVQAARTLSTRNLTGITLHSPSELILSARAGTPVAEIEALLATAGQHLIAEPPDYRGLLGSEGGQTIGGAVSVNLSGPRRIAWGAMRDHVMGLRFVNGAGEVLSMGGRVLKNVTGLDLCKLLTGAHGTLGVITEVTLKVLPMPERRATLVLAGLDPVRAVTALSEALGSPYAVSGAAYLPAAAAQLVPALSWMGGAVALVRLEDFSPSVAYRSERLRAELATFARPELLDDGASREVWAAIRDVRPLPVQTGQAVWRVSVRPSASPRVAQALDAAGVAWFMDWGGGLIWIAGPATEAMHDLVMHTAQEAGGVWTLMRAPDALRTAVAVIPPESAALALINGRVKAAFDPKMILNPGRMRASG